MISQNDGVLIIFSGSGPVKETNISLINKSKISFGRGQTNDIVIDSGVVSKIHGYIENIDGRLYIYDNNSTNGIFINDVYYGSDSRGDVTLHPLTDGDIIRIDISDNSRSREKGVVIVYRVNNNSGVWKEYLLSGKNEISVGSSGKNTIRIKGRQISKHHAIINKNGNSFFISDRSAAETCVNGRMINGSKLLMERDIITFGDSIAIFAGDKLYYKEEYANNRGSAWIAVSAAAATAAVITVAAIGIYTYQLTKESGGEEGKKVPPELFALGTQTEEITLDGDDLDVEIYSFDSNVHDIPIGTSKQVKFTAEIFANISLGETDVAIKDEDGNLIGYMNDSGNNGDAVSNDGIYTLQTELSSDTVKNVLYFAQTPSASSRIHNICFYKQFSENDVAEYNTVVTSINNSVNKFLDSDGYLVEGKYKKARKALVKQLNRLKRSGTVFSYSINENTASITLSSSMPVVYQFLEKGIDSGIGRGSIVTYQPFKNTYSNPDINLLSDEATDGSAYNISNTFEEYTFNESFDLDGVTIGALKNMSAHSIVMWHGHGGFNYYEDEGSSLATGELITDENLINYSSDIQSLRIIPCVAAGRRVYLITGGFVREYLGDMEGAFVYLGACSSGKDMLNDSSRYRLAQAFIDKGVAAVIGNSDIIHTKYNTKMERDVFKKLAEPSSDYHYNNLGTALTWAKEQNGYICCEEIETEVKIFPEYSANANDYRLKQNCGQVAGNVKSAESGAALPNALVRAYRDNSLISSVRTDENGYYDMKLPAGDYIIQIKKGDYKTAKISVNVTDNSTVYNETFIMIGIGLNGGYANGAIINALTGQNVANTEIKMRRSWNNVAGEIIYTTSTNENGYYEISYSPGFYTIEYSKEGYITDYRNIIIGVVDYEAQNAVISPEMPDDGAYRIVLSWKGKPKDLDSHLTGPKAGEGRFHLYYKLADTTGNNANDDDYRLDLDNTDIVSKPNIPETTTIITQRGGVYRYSVHDYTNSNKSSSTAMSQSNAIVSVYKGSRLAATFHVPPNVKGSIWTVFELSGDTITPVNRISSGGPDDISLY